MQKKSWAPPTITEHGDAVEKTTGFGGKYWEWLSPMAESDIKPDPDDGGSTKPKN